MAKAKGTRCAVYTRKSSEEGLDQSFNSLDAQREACEAYIKSQAHEGWQLVEGEYSDGGFSGGNIERPALKRLMIDLKQGADRYDRRLQGRSPHPLVGRLRQNRRSARRHQRFVRFHHAAIQHHD